MAPRRRGRRSGRRRRHSKDTESAAEQDGAAAEASQAPAGSAMASGPLTDEETSELAVLREVLDIEVDGEWEKQTIGVAFSRLERMMQRILTREEEG